MKHIDQHTLELYALNAEKVQHLKEEIEAHLAECIGCKLLYDEMAGFYSELKEELAKPPIEQPVTDRRLTRKHYPIEPFAEYYGTPISYVPRTAIDKVWYFVRKHPVATTASTLGVMFMLGFMVNYLFVNNKAQTQNTVITDTNPASADINVEQSAIQVYNAKQELLFPIRLVDAKSDRDFEERTGLKLAKITDLDGDERNEILTTAKLVGYENSMVQHFRIFNEKKELIKDTMFVEQVPFSNGEPYSPYFSVSSMVVRPVSGGRKEIFISGNSLGRSPTILFRLDYRANVIGEYWHFGNMATLQLRDVDGDGKDELLVGGQNDDLQTPLKNFPCLVVLNPDKITGKKRSTVSPFFKLDASDAEVNYIRFPVADLYKPIGLTPSCYRVEPFDDQQFLLLIGTLTSTKEDVNMSFILDKTLKVTDVKSNDVTDRVYASQAKKGIPKGAIDQAYRDDLKQKVRYWDGKVWKKEVTKVTNMTANIP